MEMVERRSVTAMTCKDLVEVFLHLPVLRLPLIGGRIGMLPAEHPVLPDERNVRLR